MMWSFGAVGLAPWAIWASKSEKSPHGRYGDGWKAAGIGPKGRGCQSRRQHPRLILYGFPYISWVMDVLTYSDTRAKLKEVMDRVVQDRRPVVITRQRAEAVVMVSLADWNAMEETLHLLSSHENAERLHEAIRELNAGKGAEHDLV